MKRLNLKFLLLLVVPAITLAIGISFLHDEQSARTQEMWLESSITAEDDGQVREAYKQLKKYLRKNPDDLVQVRRLGYVAAKVFFESEGATQTDYLRAQRALEAAIQITTDQVEERLALERDLIKLMLAGGQHGVAYGYIKSHLERDPTDVAMTLDAATCAVVEKMDTEADNPERYLAKIIGFLPEASEPPYFDESAALDINSIPAYWMLARYYHSIRADRQRADRVIDQMFAINQDDNTEVDGSTLAAQASLHRGVYRREFQARIGGGTREKVLALRQAARDDIARARELDPTNETILLAVAQVEMDQANYDAAEGALRTVIEHHPESVAAYVRMAVLGQRRGDFDLALRATDDGLAIKPDERQLLWLRCVYQLAQRDGPGLKATVLRMIDGEMPREMVQVAQSLLPMCDNQWIHAASLLEAVKPSVATDAMLRETVLLNLAECYGRSSQIDRQLQVYNEMAADSAYGNRDDVLRGQVTSLLSLGRAEEAYTKLRSRRLMQGTAPLPQELQMLFIRVEQALGIEEEIERVDFDVTTGEIRDQVEGTPEEWIKEVGFWRKVARVTTGLIASDTAEKRQKALDFYRNALDLYKVQINEMPEDQRKLARQVWVNNYYNYIGYLLNEKGPEKALEILDELRQTHGDTARIVVETSRIYARRSTSSKAARERLRTLESRIPELPEKEQADVWFQLGSAFARTGTEGVDDSKRCWKKGSEASPNDTAALQRLFLLARQTNDNDAMLEVMSRIKEVYSDGDPLYKYAQAHYLLSPNTPEGVPYKKEELDARYRQARNLVTEAAQVRSDWDLLYHLRGKINEELGDLDAALNDYDTARLKGSRDPRMMGHLIGTRIGRSEFGKARVLLREAGPVLPERKRYHAIIEAASGSDVAAIIRAIKDYEAGGEVDTWQDAVEVAEMYRRAARRFNDREEVRQLRTLADTSYRKALDVGPDVADTWLVYLDYLIKTKKDLTGAEAVLRQAEAHMPDDQVRLLMAEGYIQLEDQPQVEQYLRSELYSNPDNLAARRGLAGHYLRLERLGLGIAQLEEMINFDGESNDQTLAQVMWARRQLAGVLFNTRRHEDFKAAMEHVEWNRKTAPDSVEDLLLHSRMLAMRSEPRYQLEAKAVLEEIHDKDPASLDFDSRLLLAGLLYRNAKLTPDERWDQCRRVMDLLLVDSRKREYERSREQHAMLLVQYATMLMERAEFTQAGKFVGELSRIQPTNPRTIRLLAKWSMINEDQEAAEKAIEQLIPPSDTTDETMPYLLMAARLFDEQGINHRADEVFRRLAREHASGRRELAKYLARSGSAGEALFIAEEMAEQGDLLPACRVGLLAIRELGSEATEKQRKQVSKWFDKGRGSVSDEEQYTLRMLEADFAIFSGDAGRAIEIYREMLASKLTFFEEGQVSNNLAYVLAARGENLAEAESLVDRSLSLVGPTAGALDTKGVVHLAKQECDLAIEALEEATSMDANRIKSAGYLQASDEAFAQSYFHLALAYQCANEKEKARTADAMARDRGFRIDDIKPLKRSWYDELDAFLAE